MAIDMSTKALKNISNYVKGRAVHNAGTRSQTTLLVINTVPLGLKLIASPRCANRHENCTADPSSNKRMYLSSTGLRLERVIWRTTRRQVLFSDDWPATSWSYDRTMETLSAPTHINWRLYQISPFRMGCKTCGCACKAIELKGHDIPKCTVGSMSWRYPPCWSWRRWKELAKSELRRLAMTWELSGWRIRIQYGSWHYGVRFAWKRIV